MKSLQPKAHNSFLGIPRGWCGEWKAVDRRGEREQATHPLFDHDDDDDEDR